MYQYLIYDNDSINSYNEDGLIYDYSNLYTKEEDCEREAIEACNELNKEFEDPDRFQYRVVELTVVK